MCARRPDYKLQFSDYCLYELELKPGTVKAYLRRLEYQEQFFGKPIEDVTSDDLRRMKKESPWSSQTVHGLIVAARQFHIWGALEGHWKRNGVALVRTPRIRNNSPRPLTTDQARELLGACRRPLEYRLIYLGLYTGMRIGESAQLHGSMWREDQWLYFRGKKTDEMREIPAHPRLVGVKWDVLGSPPTYESTLQRVRRRLTDRTGIPFKSHQLRKTFSQSLADADVPDRSIKTLLGHRDGEAIGSYRWVNREKLRAAVAHLPY